jgi:hypothetical protein
LAAILPAAALSRVVEAKAETPSKPSPAPVLNPKKIQTPKLKDDRYIQAEYCAGFCDCPAPAGTVMEIAKFVPSPDGSQYPIVRPGRHSGQPIGILTHDVVNMDLSRQPLFMGNAVPVGGKVSVCQEGWLVAGPFDKPVKPNETLYYDKAGKLTTEPIGTPIGITLSSSDEDGFAQVKVNLYVNENAELPRAH